MNQKHQFGAVRASILVNILLGIGILSAVVFLLYSNSREAELSQPVAATTPIRTTTAAPPPPLDEKQIDNLKSKLEIETLKLERLRIQTEQVRTSQRRAQAVAPETSTEPESPTEPGPLTESEPSTMQASPTGSGPSTEPEPSTEIEQANATN